MPKLPEFNFNSKDHLSAILYGGYIKAIDYESVVLKNGKVKLRKVEKKVRVSGMGLQPLVPDWLTKKAGVYKTGKEVLLLIAGEVNNDDNND